MTMRGLLQAAAGVCFFMASGGRVLAQAPATIANEEASYLVWVVFGGAALIICATGFMNPKRSHLN